MAEQAVEITSVKRRLECDDSTISTTQDLTLDKDSGSPPKKRKIVSPCGESNGLFVASEIGDVSSSHASCTLPSDRNDGMDNVEYPDIENDDARITSTSNETELIAPKSVQSIRTSNAESCDLASSSSSVIDSTEKEEFRSYQSETDAGITEYVSPHEGFSAVLKQRYSDFLVNEIAPIGKIVRLTSLDPPIEEPISTKIGDVMSEETIKKLQSLSSEETEDQVVINVTDKDKDGRRKIHEAIRHHFNGLDSHTDDRDGCKVIVVTRANFRVGKGKKTRVAWPPSRGNFAHFILYKENRDTMEAVNTVAGLLKMKPASFTYAGTKDKRAKTSQRLSVYRILADSLLSINNNSKLKGITIGNVEYKENPVHLGDLSGNHFAIILRNMNGTENQVDKAMTSLIEKGFINYYGMQRFGVTSVPTHAVGRALLQGNWKDAIDLILKPRCGEDPNMAATRQIWQQTKNAQKAWEHLHRKGSIEGQLLRGIASNKPKDYVNALNAVPRNTRLMYIHSYQSYIWNKIVSMRISTYGLQPIVGDLFLPLDSNGTEDTEDAAVTKICKATPKIVTEAEIKKNEITMYNIVFPLPGHSVQYPKNQIEQWYRELLIKDGLDLYNFHSRVRTYSLGGSYRHLIVQPKDVSWSTLAYEDPTKPLLLSDFDILQGNTLVENEPDGRYKALKIEFSLPSSSYATMAVREVLKMDTSIWAQKSLNPS